MARLPHNTILLCSSHFRFPHNTIGHHLQCKLQITMADQEKYDPQAHAALLRQLEKMELQRKAHEQAEAEAKAKTEAEAELKAARDALANNRMLLWCTFGTC